MFNGGFYYFFIVIDCIVVGNLGIVGIDVGN